MKKVLICFLLLMIALLLGGIVVVPQILGGGDLGANDFWGYLSPFWGRVVGLGVAFALFGVWYFFIKKKSL